MGIDPHRDLSLRLGMFGAEPWSEAMRAQIEAGWGIVATDNYGLSEVVGPRVAGECQYRDGMHINEDHFLVEIIDPRSEQPMSAGSEGELVITPLTKEALPLVRYRTGDFAVLDDILCPCGRTTRRIKRIKGRTDEMLIVNGVNIYPSQVEEVILKCAELAPIYQIVKHPEGVLQRLEVQVEVKDKDSLPPSRQKHLFASISKSLAGTLGIHTNLTLLPPGSLERSEGKAKHIVEGRARG
jgi:phenylacetate-CoA ligase